MNILNKFIIRSLKLNKKRTIVTIIGIALSTALIAATAGLVSSFQATLLKDAIQSSGNYHVEFKNVTKEQENYLINSKDTKRYAITQNIGYANIEKSQNEYKPYIFITEYNDNALANLAIHLTSGRMPKNSNEIIIPQHILEKGGVNYKVGDKITLNIGDRISDENGEKLDNSEALLKDEETDVIKEHISTTKDKIYEVVGIMERLDYSQEGYSSPGYVAISKLETENNTTNVFITYKNVFKTYEITNEINKNNEFLVSYNSDVLRYSGVAENDNVNSTLYSIAGIVIGIIIVSSVFVIRNSFSISVTEKYKQYGMLASIGATPKQIKRNVLFEGAVLGVIGIPLGILGSILAVSILCWLINLILGEYLNDILFTFSMPIWAILVGVVLSAVTIYFSCVLPARKAAKISPIDAIRSNQDIKIKRKKLKISPVFKKLFNIGGQISLKNLKRNKKKYRTTVISLVVSISIFISLASVIKYGFDMGESYYTKLNYNIMVNIDGIDVGETQKRYDEILKLANITDYSYWKTTTVTADKGKYVADKGDPRLTYEGLDSINITVISMLKNKYDELLKELKGKSDEYKDKAILIDDYNYYQDGVKKTANYLKINDGEKITLTDGKVIEVAKRTDYKPMGLEYNMYSGAILIVSDEYFKTLGDEQYFSSLVINSSNPDKLESDIKALPNSSDVDVSNYNDYVRSNNAIMLIISIFLYGFITVITLIGVTNIFNTITTNMALRSKEFAILKSIGMTTKEFNKMIRLESIMYGAKSLFIGIPIGLVLSYIIYKNIVNMEMAYAIPIIPIIICVVFVFLIVSLTMKYSLNKINEQNIIETIRNDNI